MSVGCVYILCISVLNEFLYTVHGKFLAGEKLANLVNCEPFAKIFLTNIHRYTEMYLACALILAYSPIFYLHSSPKFSWCTIHSVVNDMYVTTCDMRYEHQLL